MTSHTNPAWARAKASLTSKVDNICRTMYLLDFIDDVTVRQAVQKTLNRSEAYNRFRR